MGKSIIGQKLISYFLENDTVSMMLKVVQTKIKIQLAAILQDHIYRNTIKLTQLKIVVKEVYLPKLLHQVGLLLNEFMHCGTFGILRLRSLEQE